MKFEISNYKLTLTNDACHFAVSEIGNRLLNQTVYLKVPTIALKLD